MTTACTVFFLHGLGSSGRAFAAVEKHLDDHFQVRAIDLPGFGGRSAASGTTVLEMVRDVERVVSTASTPRWLLVGHSMGGKLASVVAARTLAGINSVFGLAGVVLLAGSPPSPEPMDAARRKQMLGWSARGALDEAAARTFVDANVGSALPADLDALAVADVRRSSASAWTAWLERGSREDWSDAVGRLDLPALVLAGAADDDLGAAAQPAVNGSVYPGARFVTLPGAGHLLPLERPVEVAAEITRFWLDVASAGPEVPLVTARVIASARTGRRARSALAGRALADDREYRPRALGVAQLATLRAIANRIVPQDGPAIDLAARLDARLARGDGDGWRFAELPRDVEAYRSALDALDGFAALDRDEQDAMLGRVAGAQYEREGVTLTSSQLALWFQDVCDDLARLWLAHPATMDRIGFDGYANGGDAPRKEGFHSLGVESYDEWEPVSRRSGG